MSIPVTILGGFLGAGKTTAVNHMLRAAACRMGVLVNDFGAVNIDAALIAATDGDIVALSNGCVCCAMGPDLSQSLALVVGRAPERIVIEASGVSDPWRIAQLVRLEAGVALDAVLVLVDATRFAEDLADRWLTDTLERQVARADIVAISKCDAGDAAVATTRAALERLRPEVAVLEIFGGAVPAALLGLAETAPASRFLADAPDHGFRAWHWPIERPLNARVLAGVLDGLPGSVLRAKGFCRLGPAGAVHALQRVGRRWNLTPWEGEVPGFELVLIGTAAMPAEAALQAVFAAAVLQ